MAAPEKTRHTKQKQLIMEVLRASPVPLTAGEIYARAVSRQPTLAKSTVYRNLDILCKLGKLAKVGRMDGPEAFDTIFPWLQLKAHATEPPEGKVFVLLSKYEGETSLPVFSRLDPSHAVYESPYLIALGYESVEALRQDAAS